MVKIDVRREARGVAADDREHERHPVSRRADDRLRAAADPDPGGQAAGFGRRKDRLVGERRTDAALPGDRLLLEHVGEEVELLLEQLLVLAQFEAEERERLGERPATQDDLGPAVRHGVERREPLEHPDRVVRAEHGDR